MSSARFGLLVRRSNEREVEFQDSLDNGLANGRLISMILYYWGVCLTERGSGM